MKGTPISVRSGVQPSAALHQHIERHIERALRPHAARVARVEVRLTDANGPKHGAADKVARVIVSLGRSGRVVVGAASDDFYSSVTRAAARVREALSRRIARDLEPDGPEAA